MKNNFFRLIALLLLVCTLIGTLASCDLLFGSDEPIDYAGSIEFDPTSTETVKAEVTVKGYIDGDTTHFYVPTSVTPTGVLKARYLGINTPESTGQIEPWGKKAANFTNEKLMNATSIYIESDNGKWNLDSTGARHLVWVWYKPEGSDKYRNLNIEIMQNGLAIQSNSAQNRYGEQCVAAYNQAELQELCVHSKSKDPDFFYGEAIELTLRELRANITDYVAARVAFEGVVAKNSGSNGVYIEAYDEETQMYNGIYVYLGANATPNTKTVFTIGNRVRVVGKVSEFNGTYQVSDVTGAGRRPTAVDSSRLDTEVHNAAYVVTDPEKYLNGEVEFISGDDVVKKAYAEMALGTTVEFKNLYVKDGWTTSKTTSSSYMAFTLYCEDSKGNEVVIRTGVLKHENGDYVTKEEFIGQTIDVKGIVEYYNPNASNDDEDVGEIDGEFYYQIKVVVKDDLVILH